MSWLARLFRRRPAVDIPAAEELAERPLADLHAYAARLGIKRYRLMRREALISELASRRR